MAILIIDDTAVQRLALAGLLEDAGYTDLRLTGSAAEALEVLAGSTPEEIELVLTDIHMPGVDGIESCRRIKALPGWHDVPVIMVTSSDEAENLRDAFEAGAMDYIIKPPNEIELLARVRSALKLKHEMDHRKAREAELQDLNERLREVFFDLTEQHRLTQEEQEKSERLLLSILPKPVADRLKQAPGAAIADHFAEATVLFADIVDFTPLSERTTASELVAWLNEVFSRFDELAARYGLEKIKTSGDAYMAVAGVPVPRADHVEAVAAMALALQDACAALYAPGGAPLRVRIGVHCGPVVAGVIGTQKFIYDLWGDTVNLASRMESQGAPGRIQVTVDVYERLRARYKFEPRGTVEVKGKGGMETYWLVGDLGA